VKVSIKDSGIGIPREIIPRIFDPFYTTKTKGHGLGLATCYSIINRHGGAIDVESEIGKGSTFNVYLPASREPISLLCSQAPKHKGSGTIIVVDDMEEVRNVLQSMLEYMGYSVVCKDEGGKAVDFFLSENATSNFSAIFCDLTIPGGMGGIETVAAIRKIDGKIPVFVISGYAENCVMKDACQYGFTASVSKPFTISEISRLLNTYLLLQGPPRHT
jgi:two-component system cell cycle sensor histidine kinase/response regulator CckA